MGLLDRFKKSAKGGSASGGKESGEKKADEKSVKPAVEKKSEKKEAAAGAKKEALKGKTNQAYRVLIKPLVTEKASTLGALNKYAFAVDKKMNKIEIKKAVRSIYNVDPVTVNIMNFSGKNVRYGRSTGRTKSWKKAIVTLKPGDKIEIYEGV